MKNCIKNYQFCSGPFADISDRCRKCFNFIRRSQTKRGLFKPFFIASINIERRFGGYEEGGWYFDYTTINESCKVRSYREALRIARLLVKRYPKHKHNRFSVLGSSDDFIKTYYDESEFPKSQIRKYE